MRTLRYLALALVAIGTGCGGDDDSMCGDAGCASDGGLSDASTGPKAPPYALTSGLYKATGFTAGTDGCGIAPGELFTMNTDPMVRIQVTVDGGKLKVGSVKGTPPMAAVGEGTIDGMTFALARSNHVTDESPSTCQYDDLVAATVTLDDAATKSFGISISEKQSNRTTCLVPAGVGASCESTWSWRLTPQ
jgi:hypothetical protein